MELRRYRYLLLLLLAMFGTSRLRADVTGTITGFVHDSTGAVIPNADLVATDATTNLSKEVHAETPQGQYTFFALPLAGIRSLPPQSGF